MICGVKNDALDMTIGVDYIPGLVKPCLVIKEGACETKYASFNNPESAKEFMEKFIKLVGIRGAEE